jgi:hypothetical protein
VMLTGARRGTAVKRHLFNCSFYSTFLHIRPGDFLIKHCSRFTGAVAEISGFRATTNLGVGR